MAAAIGDDVAAQVATEQRKVAEDVEDFVACGFVAEARGVVDGTAWAGDEQIAGASARAEPLAQQHQRFLFRNERSARRGLGGEGARPGRLRAPAPRVRRLRAVREP